MTPRRVPTLFAAASLATLAAGCTLEPHYERPTAPVPAAFPQGGPYAPAMPTAVAAPDLAWRDVFLDPKLQGVIQLALDQNRDLRVAVLNIEAARAQYQVQRSDLIPHLAASSSAVYEHTPFGFGSVSTTPGASGSGSASGGTTSGSTTGATGTSGAGSAYTGSTFVRIYSLDAGVSAYELDLWGRVRSLTKQALEQYLSSEAAQRVTRISLIAEVATAYLTLDTDLRRLALAKATQANDEKTLGLARARFTGGVASELDVRQAETAAELARSDVATYSAQGAQDKNALDLLVGAPTPDALLPTAKGAPPAILTDIPAGLSSQVLLRRPDVIEAEHQLRAYNANIGAARAAFFPTISLTASGGATSLTLTNLLTSGAGTWTISPTVTLPIFDAGKNRANLGYAVVQKKIAVAQYEKAVQTAFREAADALAQRGVVSELIAAQSAYASSSQSSLTLSTARYQRGVDPYLNTLTSQLSLYSAQQSLLTAELTKSTNLVTLYRVLGGGVR